ncbi:MAG: glycine--tRNA ligase subunit beta, partial [Clostridioides sp.]|nr:glycine--tRNA ligase subunit beta [Clostridioides sp.]
SEIEVNSLEDYLNKMKENFVMLNQYERKAIIKEQCLKLAEELGGEVQLDEDLLEEVTFIVEYPTAFYGKFDEKYLSLPTKAVITPMKQHLRYFPVTKDGKLLPNFISVRNGDSYKIENVVKGNEKVLEARLADALFFYNEDTKKNLESYTEKLKYVVFQEKLGTIYEKSERIGKLSEDIIELIASEKIDIDSDKLNLCKQKALRASQLCKADLVTGMVGEFDELQGYMGKEYAKVAGEDSDVCEAIYEHYLPRFSGDILPESKLGCILSIADKLDSIAGFFAVGIKPTGSQDPYALRRQALGIVSVLIEKQIDVDFKELVLLAVNNYEYLNINKEDILNDIVDFFKDRISVQFKDNGIRYDIVDAVVNSKGNSIYDLYLRALALNEWLKSDGMVEALTAFNRVSTLAQKSKSDIVDEYLLKEEEEKKLFESFKGTKVEIVELLQNKKYSEAIDVFASLKSDIDNLFDNVMIMDKDEAIKNNRLGLLKQIYDTMLGICDLSKVVYKD